MCIAGMGRALPGPASRNGPDVSGCHESMTGFVYFLHGRSRETVKREPVPWPYGKRGQNTGAAPVMIPE